MCRSGWDCDSFPSQSYHNDIMIIYKNKIAKSQTVLIEAQSNKKSLIGERQGRGNDDMMKSVVCVHLSLGEFGFREHMEC